MPRKRGDGQELEAFLPLAPSAYHILLALAGGEKHGYAVMLEVNRLSEGAVRLGPGTLYRSLKGLLDQGLIEESGERPDPAHDDERRRYYRLTNFGQRVAQAETRRLARLVKRAQATPGWGAALGGRAQAGAPAPKGAR